MASRGTDPETERRRLRPREDEDAIARYLDALFYATGEVLLFGLPTLVWMLNAGVTDAPVAAPAALVGLCGATGVVRARWDASDREWPGLRLGLVVFRTGYYNLALAGSATIAAAHGPDDPAVLAGVLASLLGGLFPTAASAAGRYLGR
ncbi:hypothetical protein BRC82_08640 [Halobacteriales archaeon QS_1_67_19]|nr:MAG: hypothetical protein BRC82_08640 [Halobacteriales archaeon QS_1_67_19]